MSSTDGLADLSQQVVGMVLSLAVVTAVVLRARLVGLLADGLMVMAAVTMAHNIPKLVTGRSAFRGRQRL